MTLHATLNAVISVSAIIMRIERHSLPTVTPEGLYGHTRRYWVRTFRRAARHH